LRDTGVKLFNNLVVRFGISFFYKKENCYSAAVVRNYRVNGIVTAQQKKFHNFSATLPLCL